MKILSASSFGDEKCLPQKLQEFLIRTLEKEAKWAVSVMQIFSRFLRFVLHKRYNEHFIFFRRSNTSALSSTTM